LGYKVTLFESLHEPGGVLTYGIPEFRLPKKIVKEEVDYIRSLGVLVKVNILIGTTFTLEDLFGDGYKAVFLGTGAGLPNFLDIEGENAAGVYSANEFLTRVNLMKAYDFPEYATPVKVGKRVCVIGGGNVALDSARSAKRLGAEVTLVYRRTQKEMPARMEEVENAKEENIDFMFLSAPKRILTDREGKVTGLECLKMELGAPDESNRPRPVVVKGSEFVIDADTVIVAAGQSPNPLLARLTAGLEVTGKGTIMIDEHYKTSLKGVFAGGDITSGADTVISAMGAGKKAARAINAYLVTTGKVVTP
jgi:glutamate synthase (NADPH/NADH) small chain